MDGQDRDLGQMVDVWDKTRNPSTKFNKSKSKWVNSCAYYSRKGSRSVRKYGKDFNSMIEAKSAMDEWRASLEGRKRTAPYGNDATSSSKRISDVPTIPSATQRRAFMRLKQLTGWDKMTYSNWSQLGVNKYEDIASNFDLMFELDGMYGDTERILTICSRTSRENACVKDKVIPGYSYILVILPKPCRPAR